MYAMTLAVGAAAGVWAQTGLPQSWGAGWAQPVAADRPLQIVHGIDPSGRVISGMGQMVAGTGQEQRVANVMQFYRDRGLGGVVCNVAFDEYLRSEENWRTLIAGVESCRALGQVVWIYDEKGYPSGGAGGLVLQERPEYEAQALAYDATQPDPFAVRPAYEFTHASNNYHASRRYINLIDDRAVRLFIKVTHDAYRQRLGNHIGSTVKAFFTDEPSLITVNLGQIPDAARQRVPVVDPVDQQVKALPAVPWVYDLPELYRKRYGSDLLAVRRSLFVGDTDADRTVRQRYWALIADLVVERYYGPIQEWCASVGVASSGHNLWEEAIMHHPTLYGNGLKALTRFDIPGLDELSSTPEVVLNGHWMTAALPASAAILTGGRRVFTEVSDFSEKMGGKGPAPLADMQAAAAWQAAFGVTEFTLYYDVADRSAADTHAYGDYVGRLNTILKPARLDPEVLLYYPIHDLWAEYKPVAEPISMASQTPHARALVDSFNRLGQALTRQQIPFTLIDHDFLAAAKVRAGGILEIKGHAFRTLVLPQSIVLPAPAAKVVARFQARGGTVIAEPVGTALTGADLAAAIRPRYALSPACDHLVLGRFVRAGRAVLLVVNVGSTDYAGELSTAAAGSWTRLDPASGAIDVVTVPTNGTLRLALGPRQALVLIGPE
jgi:hypothetical protein